MKIENSSALSPGSATIQDSTQSSAITEASSRSTSFSARTADSNSVQRAKGAPQDRGEVLDSITSSSSKLLVRAPQFIPDDFNSGDSFYNHKSFITSQSPESSLVENLGIIHLEDSISGNDTSGTALSTSTNAFKELYLNAANCGLSSAKQSQGTMYDDDRSAPHDYSETMEKYLKAADQGQSDGQLNLGV
ncbi:hypothetical protein BGZ58_006097, partial [Dissophora ornata]